MLIVTPTSLDSILAVSLPFKRSAPDLAEESVQNGRTSFSKLFCQENEFQELKKI